MISPGVCVGELVFLLNQNTVILNTADVGFEKMGLLTRAVDYCDVQSDCAEWNCLEITIDLLLGSMRERTREVSLLL